ncbi:MAG: nonstructural protein [Microviridae sp.]|nr:MAG: nonstructural protein [Microviridae sp.]
MIKQVLAIKDQKADYFLDPMVMKTIGEGERQFQQIASDPKTLLYTNPEDFVLFHVGEFDTTTGVLTTLPVPKSIMRADAVQKPKH